MQDNLMQAHLQPFVKLAQANLDLLTRFSISSEVTAMLRQGQAAMTRQVLEPTNGVIGATDARGRRARQAA